MKIDGSTSESVGKSSWLLFSLVLLLQGSVCVTPSPAKKRIKLNDNTPVKYRQEKAAAVEAYKQQRLSDAERLFKAAFKTLESAEKNGNFFQQRVEALMDLALVYEKQGKTSVAYETVSQCIELTRQRYGPNSGRLPPLLDKLSDLAPQKQEKVKLLLESIRIRESLVGKKDPSLIQTLHSLIGLLDEPALTDTRRRYWDLKSRLPEFRANNNSPIMAFDLATGYRARKNYPESIKFASEGISLAQEQYGKNNAIELMCRIALLLSEKESGKASAETEIGQRIAQAKSIVPEGENYAIGMLIACGLMCSENRAKEALQLADLLANKVRTDSSISTARVLQADSTAASVFAQNGKIDSAKKALLNYKADVCRLIENKDEQNRQFESARRQFQHIPSLTECLD